VDISQRTTPDWIEDLEPGQVFVFGSNLAGRHGKGAAKTALGWGARYGQASGLQGRTYGIPTKNASVTRTLSVAEIEPFVNQFTTFAASRPDLLFLVTEIGCGLAGLTPKLVAPLFKHAAQLPNVWLPRRFWHKLGN